MRNAALKFAMLSVACLVIGAESTMAQTDPSQLLESHGLKKIKGRYLLAAEDEVSKRYQQTLAAMVEADQAIANAGDAVARNQSIIDFQQRIAFDQALRNQMRVERKDGTTLEEQSTARAARRDRQIGKKERAQMGLAKARVKPKEAKKLAEQAEAACRHARESRLELVKLVGETDAKYKMLAADSQVRKAIGDARLGPSDGFKKLAASLGIPKKGAKQPTSKSSEAKETPKEAGAPRKKPRNCDAARDRFAPPNFFQPDARIERSSPCPARVSFPPAPTFASLGTRPETRFTTNYAIAGKTRKPQVITLAAFLFRATSGTRTLDPSFTKAVLYQLS